MNASESTMILEEYERLSKQKEVLEAEISAIAEELSSGPNPAGLRGPLVDSEGFPRADIDVYRVRHQRHDFACKQTDHRMVMERIEKLLPQLFAARKLTQKSSAPTGAQQPPHAAPAKMECAVSPDIPRAYKLAEIQKNKTPFAVVESVQDDSPASLAGLVVGDRVLSFGTADATNHRNLEAIREIVLRNVGSAIPVVVIRRPEAMTEEVLPASWEAHELSLIPQQWRGAGVLGCLVVPFNEANTPNEP